ncbi:SPOR domain-containing protein [Sphingomonas sp. KR1UV-12]|uniref:SPOR domain-containing protein n=1 Tax=Sphingomonas aurea TaxID=3063994 RepID=A0ABT9EG95_9SPHN|nr:SPOR domain-containing protein [Sphingomonas sp. KR1UV-12]MDP1025643.1 SPOR domain-containing protein [Sphingomonas sp. KR1UV-12]
MRDERYLRDEDRLPWLETVEPDEEPERSWGRMIALLVVGMAVAAGVLIGVVTLRGGGERAGTGQLIPAEVGPYKVRPEEPGGLKVEGEGDTAIATSAGKGAGAGAIDLNAVPEAPVDATRAPSATATPSAAPAPGRNVVAQVPERGGRLVAAAPLTADRPAAAAVHGGGSLVQLGAYPSEAVANASWDRFAKRFAYLAPLTKTVQPVAREGKTLYRLRVDAGSANQAAELCGRLRVAGEACFVAG